MAFAITCSVFGRTFAADDSQQQKLFSFGVIADIQWGDKGTIGNRHYREALDRLKECVQELNKQKLAFTIQLGDVIDGNETSEKTRSDLEIVLEEYGKLSMPKYHVVGNHCLNAGKKIIHHITVKAMVEAPIRNAYAVIEVYPDKLNEIGYGKEPSRELKLEGLGSAAKKATAAQQDTEKATR